MTDERIRSMTDDQLQGASQKLEIALDTVRRNGLSGSGLKATLDAVRTEIARRSTAQPRAGEDHR